MGVLNVTPDSFSEKGLYFEKNRALEHGHKMVEEGADIIDVGGESTRPGSLRIDEEEERSRVIPVIEGLSKLVNIPISIDTYKANVAEAAIEAGASMINDISGLRFDQHMPYIAAKYNVPVVIMHIKGVPETMQFDTRYNDLMEEIREYLKKSIDIAKSAGVKDDHIIVDPGIGFGKSYRQNLVILNKLSYLKKLGKPILIGPSKKAFIGDILGGLPPNERVEGTAASVAISIMNGANIVRVHDVKVMSRVAKVADAIKRMDY
ncbi:MAG: dihydropteroate synthase [Nitrospirae bacterium]|nr:MAG: dihydropteroate synthase [Nitrospirota bacterium]